jgi:serine/threonine protein phosphatase PrpC
MTESTLNDRLQTAAVTDRGLSDKRPLNEDSFLADAQRHIFAVADGVGGAQAGEVASQTAIEVLDEAFRHHEEGTDIEDLMEIAIQRANASIHRMAREHPKFAMMATTVVALHLKDNIATIGHVGDSRLYRLSREGKLYRETADHSVVEDEVRAGRMTADQAAHHPSRNVISRALGVEDSVEVDLKTMEVENGTTFLLCSDGITRHIPDDEIRGLLAGQNDPREICAEMKKRCFERGAEDNLTAILVRMNGPGHAEIDDSDDERTISLPRPMLEPARGGGASAPTAPPAQAGGAGLIPPSRIVFPAEGAVRVDAGIEPQGSSREGAVARPKTRGRSLGRFLLFVVVRAAVAAGAFYGGLFYKQQQIEKGTATATATPTPMASPEDSAVKFARELREVDKAPSQWLATEPKRYLAAEGIDKPLDSKDPQFLYLYGRALLLTGDHDGAIAAFEQAIARLEQGSAGERSPLKVDARLGKAAAALRSDRSTTETKAIKSLEEVIVKTSSTPSP